MGDDPDRGSTQLSDDVQELQRRLEEPEGMIAGHPSVEARLRASEERFGRLLESIRDAYLLADRDGRILSANPPAASLLGREGPTELLSRNLAVDVCAEPSSWERVDEALAETGQLNNYELLLKRKDGATFPAECSIHLARDHEGEPATIEMLFSDLGERKRTDEKKRIPRKALELRNRINNALLTSPDENPYAEMLEIVLEALGSPYGIFGLVAENGDLVLPQSTRSPWDENQVLAWSVALPPGSWGGICRRALTEGRTLSSNVPLQVPEGHVPITRAVASRLVRGRSVLGLLGVANRSTPYSDHDIALLEEIAAWVAPVLQARMERDRREAERSRTEETLRESELRYRELAQRMSSGVAVYRPVDDGADFAFVDFNRAGERIENIAREEVIGRRVTEVFPGVEEFGLLDVLRRVSRTGIPEHHPIALYRDERVVGWRENSVYRLPSGEVVAVYDDLTEHKRAEQERRELEAQVHRVQRMEALGTLAGGIAHDFNNLLQGILGYADLAKESLPPKSNAHACLKEVIAGSRRAAELVKQILAFSRKAEQDWKPIRIQNVLAEALKLLRPALPSTIEIEQHVDAGLDPILASPTQLHQVVMNLATNAAHAMREGGGVLEFRLEEVKLAEASARADGLAPGSYARLSVGDTGSGMDVETVKRIFEPYFTTKDVGEGTGLGLATVHGIVTSHGGAISVESTVGLGSQFEILLPLAAQSSDVPDNGRNLEPSPEGTERLLFVDDDEGIAAMTKLGLERLGYTVETRTSGVEALEAFRAKPERFDVVITDQTMPKMTGADFARKVLEIRPDCPIVLCTGFSEVLSEEQARAMGIGDYIRKPIIVRELAAAIRHVLHRAKDGAISGPAPS